MPRQPPRRYGEIIPAVTSAALFGATTPAAKALLSAMPPLLLAGLFYLGSGLLLSLWGLGRRYRSGPNTAGRMTRNDLGWLAAVVVSGGIAGPVLFFTGLAATPASTSAILLNLEGVFTILLARLVFREQLGGRLVAGILLIVTGCAVAGWRGTPSVGGSWLTPLGIVGACLAWAVDTNLTRKISAGDAVTIAAAKGLVAGSITLALGLATGASLPPVSACAAALLVGALGYGPSLLLFVRSLRDLGTARTAAYFSIAPFVGALLSILFLGEALSAMLVAGGLLVGAGVWLHLTEDHAHEHQHPKTAGKEDGQPGEPTPTTHTHRHYPDVNHRHDH